MGLIQDVIGLFGGDPYGRRQAALRQQIQDDFKFADDRGIEPSLVVKHYRDRGINVPDVPSQSQRIGAVLEAMGPKTEMVPGPEVPTGRYLTGPPGPPTETSPGMVGLEQYFLQPTTPIQAEVTMPGAQVSAPYLRDPSTGTMLAPQMAAELFSGQEPGEQLGPVTQPTVTPTVELVRSPSGESYPRRSPIERVPVLGPEMGPGPPVSKVTRPARGVYAAATDPTTPRGVLADLMRLGPSIEAEQAKQQEVRLADEARTMAIRQAQALRAGGDEEQAILWEAAALNPKLADFIVKMREAGYAGLSTPLKEELKGEGLPPTPQNIASKRDAIAQRQAEEKARTRYGDAVYRELVNAGVTDFRTIPSETIQAAIAAAENKEVQQSGRRVAEGAAVMVPYLQRQEAARATEAEKGRDATDVRQQRAIDAAEKRAQTAQAGMEERQAQRDLQMRERELDREARREAIDIADENRKRRDELAGAEALLGEIEDLSGKVNTFGVVGRATGYLGRTVGASTQWNEDAARLQQQGGLLASVARSLGGERGVLTNQDIARVSQLVPNIHDTQAIAQDKLRELRAIIQAGYQRIEQRQQETGAARGSKPESLTVKPPPIAAPTGSQPMTPDQWLKSRGLKSRGLK